MAEAAASIDNSGLPLIGGPEFPIGIFWPPPPDQTTIERYQEIKDAGFTFVITGNYLDDGNIINWAETQADSVGLKVLISDDPQIRNLTRWFTISDDRSVPMSITTDDGRELVRRALEGYSKHPSFAGFNLFDEPSPAFFPSLAKAFAIVRNMSPTSLAYANLYDAELSSPDEWRVYVEQFIQTVQPSLISFDQYPIRLAGFDTSYFTAWSIFRSLGLKYGLPTWTFIQSVNNAWFRSPTGAEMAWLINISLAYGAKGIQYFTYWTPDPARGEGFGPALVGLDGKLTEKYHAAKKINTHWLSRVGRQLKPLVSERVVHVSDPAPAGGVTPFTSDQYVTSVSGDPLIIGQFLSQADTAGDRWLLLVNRFGDRPVSTVLGTGQGHVTGISRFDPKTQTYQKTDSDNTISTTLPAGHAEFYRLHTN